MCVLLLLLNIELSLNYQHSLQFPTARAHELISDTGLRVAGPGLNMSSLPPFEALKNLNV